MIMNPVTVPSLDGVVTLDAAVIYATTKAAFLADYADDQAVLDKITRHGDLAEREYTGTLKHLVPEACARVSRDEIEQSMVSIARGSFVRLALNYRKR